MWGVHWADVRWRLQGALNLMKSWPSWRISCVRCVGGIVSKRGSYHSCGQMQGLRHVLWCVVSGCLPSQALLEPLAATTCVTLSIAHTARERVGTKDDEKCFHIYHPCTTQPIEIQNSDLFSHHFCEDHLDEPCDVSSGARRRGLSWKRCLPDPVL